MPAKKKVGSNEPASGGRRGAHGQGAEATPPSEQSHDTMQASLEAFLVATQKSLARSVRSAQQTAKAENEFALGERPVYMIDGLEMEVSAAVSVSPPASGQLHGERILLDFNAPGDARSKIRFRITTGSVALLTGAKLELANLDPLGERRPAASLRAWLVDSRGVPAQNHAITLHFVKSGEKRKAVSVPAKTDVAGRVDFLVLPDKGGKVRVQLQGDPAAHKISAAAVDERPLEYFVWATAPVDTAWETLAEPSAPRPPYEVPKDKNGRPRELLSEMHKLSIY